MIPKQINEVAEADIQQLKSAGMQEGRTIEYKRELPGTRDEDKREFLADVSSFANTETGDILYGVAEEQGLITDIIGVTCPDFDAEILRLENLIRDGISPRINVTTRIISCTNSKLLLIRVDKSWISPHRVIFKGLDRFYARTSAGKFPLDVSQLRTAFLQSATLAEQISNFRLERVIEVANDRAPVPLEPGPTLMLHILPLGVPSEQPQYDVRVFARSSTLHRPWQASGWNVRMTFDGALVYDSANAQGRNSSYAHFYRNGTFEAVTSSRLESHFSEHRGYIPHTAVERDLIDYLPKCFESLQRIEVRPPVSVMLTLIGVRGLRMAMDPMNFGSGEAIRETNLVLPGTIVDDFATPAISILKPMFDRIWNACGLMQSWNFDDQGNWMPRRW
jgi:hypothetical protein